MSADFPQEPRALWGLLAEVFGPNDDITLFEYVKRNNREKVRHWSSSSSALPRTWLGGSCLRHAPEISPYLM